VSTESDTDSGSSTNDDYECTDSDVNMDECAYFVNSCTPGITNVNSHIDSKQVRVYTLHPYMQALLYYECAG